METLLIILIAVEIIRTGLCVVLTIIDKHHTNQYDLVCRQLRESNENIVKREESWKHIIHQRDAVIEQLEAQIAALSMKFKVTYPNGQEIIAEQIKEEQEEK